MNNDYTELLTIDELCELLKISPTAAYRLVSSGEINCFRIGRVWRIPLEFVNEYIKEHSCQHV